MRRTIRRCLSVLALFALLVATAYAALIEARTGFCAQNDIGGSCGWGNWGTYSTGHTATNSWSEYTYVQTRVNGYVPAFSACTEGYPISGWCADNSRWIYYGQFSRSQMRSDIIPYGCWSGTSLHYVNNVNVAYTNGSSCAPFPPPPTGCYNNEYEWRESYWACTSESPILIATGAGNSYALSKDAVLFDINADGQIDRVAKWTKPDSDVAFLALPDRNGNDVVDDGSELFGNNTVPGVGNGFQALAQLAGAVDQAQLDASNPLWGRLRLWYDRNHNGESEAGELEPVASKLEAIGLGFSLSNRKQADAEFRFIGWARKAKAGKPAADVLAREEDKRVREFSIFDLYLPVR